MNLQQNEKNIMFRLCRQFIYFVLIFAFILGMHFLAHVYGVDTFEENSVVENIQLSLLLFSAVCFCSQAGFYKDFRSVLFLLASCCLLAACRELDAIFDKIIPVLHWKFAFVFPFAAVVYAYMHRSGVKKSLLKFFAMPAFDMMYLTAIIILPIAQCVGHRAFVKNVLGMNHIGNIKELYEESLEVVGYFLIFLSSIEMYFNLKEEKSLK